MTDTETAFDGTPVRIETGEEQLQIDLPSYEGPLDMLVDLARARKVDLNRISVLAIAEQFLDWFRKARSLRLELAADWLVMAATLALLKSKLLIPVPKDERDKAEAAIEDLASRLRRLDAIRSIAEELQGRRQLGVEWHRPLAGERERGTAKRLDANLHALLSAYVREARKTLVPPPAPVKRPFLLLSVEDAIHYLQRSGILAPDWKPLQSVVPPGHDVDPIQRRSKLAAAYVASLELSKRGVAEIRQMENAAGMVEVRHKEAS